ncbi:MAG: hypothetical protein M0Z44_07070 [Gammaproteobacteria bacterium]|nr:hypothetical protein [Gammaproteobacteria bacterium]
MRSATEALSGWLKGTREQMLGDWPLWLAVTLLYLTICVVVARVPFVGPVLIALYTPLVIMGILGSSARAAQPLGGRLAAILWGPLRAGWRAWPALLAAAYVLGAWMLTTVLAMLFGIDALSFHTLFAYQSDLGSLLVGTELLMFWILRSAVAVTAILFLAGSVVDGLPAQAALEHALGLWTRAPRPMLALALGVWPALVASYLPLSVLIVVTGVTLVPLVLLIGHGYRGLGAPLAETSARPA